MKISPWLITLLCLTSPFFALPARAEDYSVDELTFPIPKGWREASQTELQSLQATLRRIHQEDVELLTGFCPANNTIFEFPKIVIQLKRGSKVPYEVLKTIHSAQEELAQAKTKQTSNKLEIEFLARAESSFDLATRELTGTYRTAMTGAKTTVIHNRTVYTEFGSVLISYQCFPQDWTKNQQAIRDVVTSLKIREKYRYRVSPFDFGWEIVMGVGVSLLLTAFLLLKFGKSRAALNGQPSPESRKPD